ncbi:MAG: lipoyl(octanoyl) transferase LipB [Legionellaceae bacterium]|nr:lipoyl(octanoyl) transferase LipB [Legionellaceae bacterium]
MLIIRSLGTQPYSEIWNAMKKFTDERTIDTPDEIWLLQHPPVYTQGQAGKPEHILNPGNIPVVQSDRGGQVTYHGPGQLIAYVLMDIKRRNLGIRTLVCELERSLIRLLNTFDISAETQTGAPGVYVNHKKIASIGLRVRRGCTYHGFALNINMDLKPFLGINPCGYAGLNMTQLQDHAPKAHIDHVEAQLKTLFMRQFEGDADAALR